MDDTLDRKPRAAQSVAQGFPSHPYIDRMGLQSPTHHGLVGRRGRSNPKRTYSIDETLRLFPRPSRFPEVEQCRRPPYGQDAYDITRAIAGFESTGIVAAQEANGGVVGPIEMRGRPRKSQRLIGSKPGQLD